MRGILPAKTTWQGKNFEITPGGDVYQRLPSGTLVKVREPWLAALIVKTTAAQTTQQAQRLQKLAGEAGKISR